MLALDEAVEKEKLSFLVTLQSQFAEIGIEHISVASSQIEKILEFRITDVFLRNISRILHEPQIRVVGVHFKYRDYDFEVASSDDLREPETLNFSSICRSLDRRVLPVSRYVIPLRYAGKYRQVAFILPSVALVDETYLNTIVNAIFDVGYRWLADSITQAIARAISDTRASLYQFVRVMVQDPEVLNGFWFSVLLKDRASGEAKDVVILDDIAARLSMQTASDVGQSLGRNPASIVTQMMTEIVDEKDSVIRDAAAKDSAFEIDLRAGRYYNTDVSFSLSLQAIWGTHVVCYPILTEGDLILVAFYKTDYQSFLTPFVTIHKAHIQELAKQNADHIEEGLKVMKKIKQASGDSLWRIGDLLGGFAGGFFKSMSKG